MRADLHRTFHLDLDDWLCGERDWRTLAELLNELPTGCSYYAAILEDPEMADPAKSTAPSPESPSYREFDTHRYDFARMIALLERLVVLTGNGDPSGIEPFVPVPLSETMRRDAIRSDLDELAKLYDRIYDDHFGAARGG